jgi:hypothetical protein
MVNVEVHGQVATFTVTRNSDKHELSLSSADHSCIEWNGREVVKDHGWITNNAEFLAIFQAFTTQ